LDPSFGIQVLNEEKKISTQSRTISLVKQMKAVDHSVSQQNMNKDEVGDENENKLDVQRHNIYYLF
jgi:hypothetical protein